MSDARTSGGLDLLLRSAHDSAESYRQGAELARNPTFQALFRDRTQKRQQLIETIQAQARSFGIDAVEKGTVTGETNRLITLARNALSGDSDRGLLEDLVRREHIVAREFARVAGDDAAPETARKIAARALSQLAKEEGELEALSEQFRK
jgi:uncharacterized protein (TIGR02284 family)